jgi:hypothetical protein
MIETIQDAKALLEKQNLHVVCDTDQSLLIVGTIRDAGEGVRVSNDACALLPDADRWFAVFPTEGSRTFEVPGTLDELVQLIQNVYKRYFRAGISLPEAFRDVVKDPSRYLLGRPLSPISK